MEDLAAFFGEVEVAAVRECFSSALPDTVVERILELRFERRELITEKGNTHIQLFKDGRLHGKSTLWFKRGYMASERHYRDGKLHGVSTEWWYTTGCKCHESHYMDDKEHGPTRGFFTDGQLSYENNFQNGKRHGKCTEWLMNGRITYEKYYQNGNIEYYKDGLQTGQHDNTEYD